MFTRRRIQKRNNSQEADPGRGKWAELIRNEKGNCEEKRGGGERRGLKLQCFEIDTGRGGARKGRLHALHKKGKKAEKKLDEKKLESRTREGAKTGPVPRE